MESNLKQQSLLSLSDLENITLQSPVFKARPGWGGQLANWLKRIFQPGRLIQLLGFGLLFLGIYFIAQNIHQGTPALDNPVQLSQNTAPEINIINYAEVAKPGQGVTHLARQALSNYLQKEKSQIALSAEQRIYIEDYLKDRAGSRPLEIGQGVAFLEIDIRQAIEKALVLKEWQLRNLSKYVK